VVRILKKTTLKQAKKALKSELITVTANVPNVLGGGIHDSIPKAIIGGKTPMILNDLTFTSKM
jgi:hypothetical protein